MKRTEIKTLLQSNDYGNDVNVKGWVRTKRGSKNVAFIALNDGSTIKNVQIVVEVNPETEKILERIHTGAALSVDGKIIESPGSGQSVEIHAIKVDVLGTADPDEYPLQPKKDNCRKQRHEKTQHCILQSGLPLTAGFQNRCILQELLVCHLLWQLQFRSLSESSHGHPF